jgi:outer membrane protein assembly factor BamA
MIHAAHLLFSLLLPSVGITAERAPKPTTVDRISITGNKAITTEEIRSIMLTTTRSSFLGTGLFAGAERPFSSDDFDKDIGLIRKLYTFKGYFSAGVDTTIVRKPKSRNVDLFIRIRENEPSRVDSVSYAGLESIPAEMQRRFERRKSLNKGDIFSVEQLIAERDRTVEFFRDHGYALFHPDSIRIKVDTAGLNAGVRFRVALPGQLVYGPVGVVVHAPSRRDEGRSVKHFTRDSVAVTIYGKQKFNDGLFANSIAFRPGTMTRYSLEQRTLQNFGATGLFSSISIDKDSLMEGRVYSTIHLDPSPKHLIEPKLLVDNRYGSLFIGSSLAYENRNLFGGAEQFRLTTAYGTQTTGGNSALDKLDETEYEAARPYEMSVTGSLVMPVLKKHGSSAYSVTTEYSQSRLPVLLSNKKGLLRASYSTNPTKHSRINFDFFEIELAQKDSLRGFRKLFIRELAENIGVDPNNTDDVTRSIDSLLQRRINQTFRLQYSYSNRPAQPRTGHSYMNLNASAEESGSLFWLIDRYVDKESYPGFNEGDPQIFGTAYSQFIKLDTHASLLRQLSPDRQVAGRVTLGWMSPYGNSETTPEDRRFYAGGANSMRGWLFNTLGPGNSTSEAASNFGADIKLELGLEYRMRLFRFLGQPGGVTLFSDIGNIWDRKGPYALTLKSLARDFAWDAGAGLRFGSPIGPLRFDFAWKLHDPASTKPWRFRELNLNDLTFNFGIGEAF